MPAATRRPAALLNPTMRLFCFFLHLPFLGREPPHFRFVCGDMYLHNPRGSNNKLSEESNNVQNDNRLFDSQNNAAAGYQVGDACERACDSDPDDENHNYDETVPGAMEGMMQYYRGSELWIEWTQQHGCGSDLGAERQPNVVCTVILQYMCESDNRKIGESLNGNGRSGDISRGVIRDGYLRGNQNNAGGDEIDTPYPKSRQMAAALGEDVSKASDATTSRRSSSTDATLTKEVYKYGQHEPLDYYLDCRARERNRGLYAANRNVQDTKGATATRQNNNGERHGLECAEERDYYPYWHPSPWHDIAIFTSEKRCDYFQEHSQNVEGKHYCRSTSSTDDFGTGVSECSKANNEFACAAMTSAGGQWLGCAWTEFPSWNELPGHYSEGEEEAPECYGAYKTRDNHNGNYGSAGAGGGFQSKINGQASHYVWEIPDHLPRDEKCVFRIRYNITNLDFVRLDPANEETVSEDYYDQVDSSFNDDQAVVKNNARSNALNLPRIQSGAPTCKDVTFTAENQRRVVLSPGGPEGYERYYGCDPITNVEQTILNNYQLELRKEPTPFSAAPVTLRCCETNVNRILTVNANENQLGRTFQDRSHAFVIRERPEEISGSARIVNYNVRGRRGNIVQVYPAVEYDFVPPDLEITEGDFLHFQWSMSDANANNAGNGRAGTDRANLVQVGTINVAEAGRRGALVFSAAEHLGPSTKLSDVGKHTLFCDYEDAEGREREDCLSKIVRFAYLGQTLCTDRNNDQAGRNCAQLNSASPYFNYAAPIEMKETGTFFIKSTRNDDFSNRSQKARITVRPYLTPLAWFAIVLAGVCALAVPIFFLLLVRFQAMNPGSDWSANRFRVNCCVRRALGGSEEAFTKWLEERRGMLVAQHEQFQRSKSGVAADAAQMSLLGPPHQQRGLLGGGAATSFRNILSGAKGPSFLSFIGKALCGCCNRKSSESAAGAGGGGGAALNAGADGGKPKVSGTTPTSKVGPADGPKPPPTTVAWRATGEGGGEGSTLHIKGNTLLAICFLGAAVAGWVLHLEKGYHASPWFCCAKAGGYVLNLSCSLLTLPMLRFLASAMRQSSLRMFVLEDPVAYHKFIAKYGIGTGVFLHVLGHIMHTIEVTSGERYWYERDLFIEPPSIWHEYSGMNWAEYFLFFGHRGVGWTGVLLLIHLMCIVVFALDYVRRKRWHVPLCKCCVRSGDGGSRNCFGCTCCCRSRGRRKGDGKTPAVEAAMNEKDVKPLCSCLGCEWVWKVVDGYKVFWVWHSPYSIAFWYFLIVVHAPYRFLIWMSVPVVLIICDHVLGKESQSPYAVLHSATLAKGDTLKLHFARPPGFVYEAGQYAEIYWRGERHPFTICSAPEENVLSFAIRAKDDLDWCSALRKQLINYAYELEHFSPDASGVVKNQKPEKYRGPPCGTVTRFSPGVTSTGVLYSAPLAGGGGGGVSSAYAPGEKLRDHAQRSLLAEQEGKSPGPTAGGEKENARDGVDAEAVQLEGKHTAALPSGIASSSRRTKVAPAVAAIKGRGSSFGRNKSGGVAYTELERAAQKRDGHPDVASDCEQDSSEDALSDSESDVNGAGSSNGRSSNASSMVEVIDIVPGRRDAVPDAPEHVIFGREHYDFLQCVEGMHWATSVNAALEQSPPIVPRVARRRSPRPSGAASGTEIPSRAGKKIKLGDQHGKHSVEKADETADETQIKAPAEFAGSSEDAASGAPAPAEAAAPPKNPAGGSSCCPCLGDKQKATSSSASASSTALAAHQGPLRQRTFTEGDDALQKEIRQATIVPPEAVVLQLGGPFGAPAQNMWHFDTVLMVGTGIGITPFAAMLRSVNIRLQQRAKMLRGVSSSVGGGANGNGGKGAGATGRSSSSSSAAPAFDEDDVLWKTICEATKCPSKLHLVWSVRSEDEFQWFYDVLAESVNGPAKDHCVINLFQTGEIALSERNPINCEFKEFAGRPDWRRIFAKLSAEVKGNLTSARADEVRDSSGSGKGGGAGGRGRSDVGVFLCGSPAVGVELKAQCQKCSQGDVRFHYFAESF